MLDFAAACGEKVRPRGVPLRVRTGKQLEGCLRKVRTFLILKSVGFCAIWPLGTWRREREREWSSEGHLSSCLCLGLAASSISNFPGK